METGLRLLVTVETVFEGGFVVSCVNPKDSRDVFKGALLRTRQPSSPGTFEHEPSAVLVTPESNLANPVVVIHDHPYSSYFCRAESILNSVPKELLLHWDSVGNDPRRGDDPMSTTFGVVSRQLPCNQKNRKETPVVLCDRVSVPSSVSAMRLIPCTNEQGRYVRQAKITAKLNLEATFDRKHQRTHSLHKQYQIPSSSKRGRKSHKTSKKKNGFSITSRSNSSYRNCHSCPLSDLQSKRAPFGLQIPPAASNACPSDLATSPQANPALLCSDESKRVANSEDKSPPATTFSNSDIALPHYKVMLSHGSSGTSSLGSTGIQGHPTSASTSSRRSSKRKWIPNPLRPFTVDVVRCNKAAFSLPAQHGPIN